MRRLWIIGNSGAARECWWIFHDMLAANAELEKSCRFEGFLAWKNFPANLGSMADLQKGEATTHPVEKNDVFVIGIGAPALRAEIYTIMKDRGARFFTLVHPWSDLGPATIVGEANIFQRGCSVFCDTSIGNANYFNGSVSLSHDTKVGDANFFGPFALLLGGCVVGSRNLVAVRSTLLEGAKVGDDNMIDRKSVV